MASFLEQIDSTTCAERFRNDWLRISTCPVPSSGFLSFVAVADIPASQQSVLSLLYDIDAATEWVWKTREMRVLEELTENNDGRVVYQLVSAPWPVTDREIVSRSVAFMDPVTSEAFIRIECLPDHIPEDHRYVRVRRMEGAWNILPVSEERCRVVFRLHIEPAGEIPSWLANLAVIDTPYHTMCNLREMVRREKYRTPVNAPFRSTSDGIIRNYEDFID